MKKLLISLILILSLFLSGCEFLNINNSNEGSTDNTVGGGSSGNSESITASDGHSDEDNNGKCDDCGETVIIELNFFVLNDFHGKISDSDTQPGIEELSMYLRNSVKNNPNSVLLSSGDMWQGGAESNLTKGLIVTDWMNELDFVSMTMGNHEYDWGEEYILDNEEIAEFPFLAINIYDTETDERVSYCESSVMIERAGLKIGIIGAIGDCYSSISREKVENVYFKVGDELTSLVKNESEKLRGEGADIIIYSLHDGYGRSASDGTISNSKLDGYYDPSLSSGGYVDIVFEGHTHKTYNLKDSYGIYHLQGGGDNKGYSHAEIRVNFANGNVKVTDTNIISNSKYENYTDDPFIDTLLEKYAAEIAVGEEVLGMNSSYRSGDELRQLVADLYYELGEEVFGDKYDIALGGGYISVRSPYHLEAGEVKYSDLYMLFPFDNTIELCAISGKDLKNRFFESTHDDYFISYGQYGSEIKNNIDDNATYYVIVDNYSSQYAPNNLTVIDSYDTTIFARDLLARYAEAGGFE